MFSAALARCQPYFSEDLKLGMKYNRVSTTDCQGLILPSQSVTVTVVLCVDEQSVKLFALPGSIVVEHTLIFHVGNGKDYFVSIMGSFGAYCLHNVWKEYL